MADDQEEMARDKAHSTFAQAVQVAKRRAPLYAPSMLNVVIPHLPFIILIIFFYGHFINVSAIFLIFFLIFPLHIDCTITQPLFHCHIWEIAYVISISSPQSPRQSPH